MEGDTLKSAGEPKQPGSIPGVPGVLGANLVPIIIAVVAVIISILIFVIFLKKRVQRQGILLLGLSDSGKTLIFARLIYDKFVETHTSINENVADCQTANRTVQVVDIPGQERVRNRVLDQFKSSARGLVFVVDASSVQKELRDVAEYLYSVLADETIRSIRPPLLVLANKQDVDMAKGAVAIRALLEKELNIVRKTKSSQLDTIDDKSTDSFLGRPGKDFEFDDLAPQQVTFAESSAVMAEEDEGPDLEALTEWLDNVA